MKHEDGYFKAGPALSLYWQAWRPDDAESGVMVLVHGHGEHSGRYDYTVQRLVANGFSVFTYDQRGHGQSPDGRGEMLRAHIESMDDYLDDLTEFGKLVDLKAPGLPRFLFGHSMGSVIVLDFIMQGRGAYKGVITSGLGTEPKGVAPPWKILLSKILSKVWPTFKITLDVEAGDLTRDPAEIQEYEQDPLIHHTASARWGSEMLKAIERVKSSPGKVQIPIVLQHGGADPLNLPSGSSNFHDSLSHPDKGIELYPDNLHDIHRDLDKDRVLTHRIDWMKARI